MKQRLVIAALLSLWLAGCEMLSQPVVPQTAAPDTPQSTSPERTAPSAPSIMLPVLGSMPV